MKLSPIKLTVANGFDSATLRDINCAGCGYPLDPGETGFEITLKGESWDSAIYCSRLCGTDPLTLATSTVIYDVRFEAGT